VPPTSLLTLRTTGALAAANARYWTTVAPTLNDHLRRWRARACAIEDSQLRSVALAKLDAESFHAQAAGMLATLAPRAHRTSVVEAIVALEVLFDYLDGVTERTAAQPITDRERLYEPFAAPFADPQSSPSSGHDYAEELSRTVLSAFRRLPAAAAVAPVAHAVALRLGAAQTRMHASRELGLDQVEHWAQSQTSSTDLGWRELLAGAASSVLVLHTLIAAAADASTTPETAADIENAYLPMSALLALIDGLVDHDRDAATSTAAQAGYIDVYSTSEELSAALITTTDSALSAASRLRPVAHHTMMVFAVVAYYTTAPGADSAFARPACQRLQNHLRPGIGPALLVMRAWRLGKRLRGSQHRSSSSAGLTPALGQSHMETGGCNEI
jgi:tetraprenyl-beta-curcumene synthase